MPPPIANMAATAAHIIPIVDVCPRRDGCFVWVGRLLPLTPRGQPLRGDCGLPLRGAGGVNARRLTELSDPRLSPCSNGTMKLLREHMVMEHDRNGDDLADGLA